MVMAFQQVVYRKLVCQKISFLPLTFLSAAPLRRNVYCRMFRSERALHLTGCIPVMRLFCNLYYSFLYLERNCLSNVSFETLLSDI